jgi:hypothetical protein
VNAHFPLEGHDYGPSNRLAAYPFFIRHLELDSKRVWTKEEQINETFAKVETEEEMRVFNDGYSGRRMPFRQTPPFHFDSSPGRRNDAPETGSAQVVKSPPILNRQTRS